MIINGKSLITLLPIPAMLSIKCSGPGGTSFGLGEAGYDIRIKQNVSFKMLFGLIPIHKVEDGKWKLGRFCLASAIEEFEVPPMLTGIVHDKSTWARQGLSVFNTVIEPGWKGFLTLELVHHGRKKLTIPAGAGIAQVIFHKNAEFTRYEGKYQNQEDRPVGARRSNCVKVGLI